jgi:hypothetical protein
VLVGKPLRGNRCPAAPGGRPPAKNQADQKNDRNHGLGDSRTLVGVSIEQHPKMQYRCHNEDGGRNQDQDARRGHRTDLHLTNFLVLDASRTRCREDRSTRPRLELGNYPHSATIRLLQ